MIVPTKDGQVNVVFEYTKGPLAGGRFYRCHPQEEIEELKKENNKPDSRTRIVAIDIPDNKVQDLCEETLAGVTY